MVSVNAVCTTRGPFSVLSLTISVICGVFVRQTQITEMKEVLLFICSVAENRCRSAEGTENVFNNRLFSFVFYATEQKMLIATGLCGHSHTSNFFRQKKLLG